MNEISGMKEFGELKDLLKEGFQKAEEKVDNLREHQQEMSKKIAVMESHVTNIKEDIKAIDQAIENGPEGSIITQVKVISEKVKDFSAHEFAVVKEKVAAFNPQEFSVVADKVKVHDKWIWVGVTSLIVLLITIVGFLITTFVIKTHP